MSVLPAGVAGTYEYAELRRFAVSGRCSQGIPATPAAQPSALVLAVTAGNPVGTIIGATARPSALAIPMGFANPRSTTSTARAGSLDVPLILGNADALPNVMLFSDGRQLTFTDGTVRQFVWLDRYAVAGPLAVPVGVGNPAGVRPEAVAGALAVPVGVGNPRGTVFARPSALAAPAGTGNPTGAVVGAAARPSALALTATMGGPSLDGTTGRAGALALTAQLGGPTGTAAADPIVRVGGTSSLTATSGDSMVLTYPTSIAVGDHVFVVVGADDNGSSASIGAVTDSATSGSFTRLSRSSMGGNLSGSEASIWHWVATAALTTADQVSIEPAGIVVESAAFVFVCSGDATYDAAYTTTAGSAGTAVSVGPSTQVPAGALAIAAVAVEGPSTDGYTGDSDTTGGDWTSSVRIGTSGGTATQRITLGMQMKILDSESTQTFNATLGTSRDWRALFVVLTNT